MILDKLLLKQSGTAKPFVSARDGRLFNYPKKQKGGINYFFDNKGRYKSHF